MPPKRRGDRCANCGSTVLARDMSTPASDISCQECGQVQEENPIVSEVQFSELSNGAATVQGSFVGSDQKRAASGNLGRNSMDSREKTLVKARKNIRDVARAMKIPDYISESLFHWFQLALTNNFVQGRKSQVVYAACLYIACRKEKTHHMLIDFSSRIQVSVFAVGGAFLRLVKILHITKLPLADPSLYISHFAEQLEFGSLKLKVIHDANKLCQRMADDWIHEGRRPAGVAGACLLLAARMNNLRRSHTELVAVSHVAEVTLQKRLNEFKQTKGAKLTVNEFRETEDIESVFPPSFLNNRKKDTISAKKRLRMKELSLENYKEDIKKVFVDGSLSEDELNKELKRIIDRQRDMSSNKPLAPTHQTPPIGKKVVFDFPEITTLELLSKVSDDPENLNDVDDDEILDILLTQEERELKARVWHGLNREFLIEQQQKKLKEEADAIVGHGRAKRKRRTKQEDEDDELINQLIGDGLPDSLKSVGGVTLIKLVMKKKSSKINYKLVDEMFEDS